MGTNDKDNEPGHDPNKDKASQEIKTEKPPMPEAKLSEASKPSTSESAGTGKPSAMEDLKKDFKRALETKDMTEVNEKYVKPAYDASKKAAITGWNFIVENTPVVIDYGKKTWAKTAAMIQEMKDKQAAKKGESSQTPTSTPPQDKSKSTSSDSDKQPPTSPGASNPPNNTPGPQ